MLERGANHPSAYPSMRTGLSHVYTSRGLRGLWAGFVPSSLGVLHGAVQFSIYENMKKRRGHEQLGNWDYVYMSGGSKLLAGAITYPYQPIRARMQQFEAASRYKGLWDVLGKTYRNEGVIAFYKGWVGREYAVTWQRLTWCRVIPNTLRVIPTTIVTFLVYENTKAYLPRVFTGEEVANDEDWGWRFGR
jgi:primary-amine oxidase